MELLHRFNDFGIVGKLTLYTNYKIQVIEVIKNNDYVLINKHARTQKNKIIIGLKVL